MWVLCACDFSFNYPVLLLSDVYRFLMLRSGQVAVLIFFCFRDSWVFAAAGLDVPFVRRAWQGADLLLRALWRAIFAAIEFDRVGLPCLDPKCNILRHF